MHSSVVVTGCESHSANDNVDAGNVASLLSLRMATGLSTSEIQQIDETVNKFDQSGSFLTTAAKNNCPVNTDLLPSYNEVSSYIIIVLVKKCNHYASMLNELETALIRKNVTLIVWLVLTISLLQFLVSTLGRLGLSLCLCDIA